MQNEIFDTIMKVEDFLLNTLLIDYYINGLRFEDIAEKLSYSTKHISRLHKKAIMAVIPFIPKE